MQVIVNGKAFDLISAIERYEVMANYKRRVLYITISGSDFQDVSAAFTGNSPIDIVEDDGTRHTHEEYVMPGPITDNRDGTLLVKMGVANTKEQDLQEQLDQSSKIIIKIAGKAVSDVNEAVAVRSDVESVFLAADMNDDEKIEKSYLCRVWVAGNHQTGETYTVDGIIWECFQAYDNSVYPDIIPGNSAWFTFNRPLHGKTPETAQPWIKPQGSHDIYRTGEYMVYINGLTYKCVSDTNFSPEEYAQAWQVYKPTEG